MSKLARLVKSKLDQWDREALIFCARHGSSGGEFVKERWANGEVMVGPKGARANQCIPEAAFESLKANGWKVAG
jgi:hypothetical protein